MINKHTNIYVDVCRNDISVPGWKLSVRVIKQCWMHGRGRYRKLGGKKDIIFD
jgi:hypothetical protein